MKNETPCETLVGELPAPTELSLDELDVVTGGYGDGYVVGPGSSPEGTHTNIWAK